jgi:hypothetical protein
MNRSLWLVLALSIFCQAPVLAETPSVRTVAPDINDVTKKNAASVVDDDEADADAAPAAKKKEDTSAAKKDSDSSKTKSKPATSKSAKNKKAGGKGSMHLGSVGHFAAKTSKRAAATLAGFSVGTPVAVVRLIAHADGEQAEAVPFIGESKKKPLIWISRALVVPTSFFSGTVQAPVYSAKNAWKESEENGFSKESFFFGDLGSRIPE